MKIDRLSASAVRDDRAVEKRTSLSRETLARTVAASRGDGCSVPPEICAIHDYYPADTLA